ncbi:alanine racemase [Opitutales bacterium]|nr:alanine racemase [Opitutales bacterium]
MRSWAEIDLAKLERNLRLIRESIPNHFKYISVVKADAYGHGILPTASRLMQSGVDLFAVANVKEASEIREMGSGWPILVLGPLLEEEDESLIELDLIPSISSLEEIDRFQTLARMNKKSIQAHVKVDTGMGRMGAWWEQASEVLARIHQCPEIELRGILTHFAEPANEGFSKLQRERFQKIIKENLPQPLPEGFIVHADNSSSLKVLEKNSVFNAVRIGLLQFGVTPPIESALAHLPVEPVLSFHAKLALTKDLPTNTSVSYGRLHTLSKPSIIGIISAGYGDAIPLHCGNQASALIRGKSYPIVGRVTMDQTLIDLTDGPSDLKNGETVTLIGEQNEESIRLETLAKHGKTIPWELLCSITKRVPRIYLTKRE